MFEKIFGGNLNYSTQAKQTFIFHFWLWDIVYIKHLNKVEKQTA